MLSRWKADRLSHSLTVCGPPFGSPITFGRLAGKPEIGGLFAWSATLAESETVNGVPELWVAMVLICPPPITARTAAGARPDIVGAQLALRTTRCRASNQ